MNVQTCNSSLCASKAPHVRSLLKDAITAQLKAKGPARDLWILRGALEIKLAKLILPHLQAGSCAGRRTPGVTRYRLHCALLTQACTAGFTGLAGKTLNLVALMPLHSANKLLLCKIANKTGWKLNRKPACDLWMMTSAVCTEQHAEPCYRNQTQA